MIKKLRLNKWHLIVFIGLIVTLGARLFFYQTVADEHDTPDAAVDLILLPSTPTLQPNETVDIEIRAYPNTLQPTATNLRLYYDQSQLQPVGDHPIDTGDWLTVLLPTCEGTANCEASSSADTNTALMIAGVNCTETGCEVPSGSEPITLGTLHLQATADAAGPTTVSLLQDPTTTDPSDPTQIAALGHDTNMIGIASATTLTVTSCPLVYDFNANGRIDIIDISQASTRWREGAGSINYNGQFDTNTDGLINIIDIQTISNSWNQSCL